MSEERLIASVRHAYDAFSRGDFDSAAEVVHPDFELVTTGGFTSLRGADNFRAWMEPVTMDNLSAEPESFEVMGNHVLVGQLNRGRGVASGINLENRSWGVWTFDEAGLATRFVMFRDDEESKAREAAGLSE